MTALIRAVLANWRCLACDTWNHDHKRQCEVCDTAKPVSRVRKNLKPQHH